MGRIQKKIYSYSAIMKKAGIINDAEYQKIIEACCGGKRRSG
jgi:hypothetical protein